MDMIDPLLCSDGTTDRGWSQLPQSTRTAFGMMVLRGCVAAVERRLCGKLP